MKTPMRMVGLGELLWDLVPSGRALGGAPANFAYLANLLGDEGVIASCIGGDELGREARLLLQTRGLSTAFLQEDGEHETGTAAVSIDGDGQPTFVIREDVAWDYMSWTGAWEQLSKDADAVCFGTLAQRSPRSAATIEMFLRNMKSSAVRVLDVNLRHPFYSVERLQGSFHLAQIVKLNEGELLRVSEIVGLRGNHTEELARNLADQFDLKLVCVTRGARGSWLVTKDRAVEHPGIAVRVADAIGAGDAFTACVIHHFVRGRSLEVISDAANRFASWVATQVGATPVLPEDEMREIVGSILHED
jgi:fructokinase